MDEGQVFYYTPTQALNKLGVTRQQLKRFVEIGEIRRYSVPGDRRQYYAKAEVDELARKRQNITIIG